MAGSGRFKDLAYFVASQIEKCFANFFADETRTSSPTRTKLKLTRARKERSFTSIQKKYPDEFSLFKDWLIEIKGKMTRKMFMEKWDDMKDWDMLKKVQEENLCTSETFYNRFKVIARKIRDSEVGK